MVLGLIYSLFRRLVGLASRDRLIRQLLAENMVLRHRLEVETRNTVRPRLRPPDTIGSAPEAVPIADIGRRHVVGGLISEYNAEAV